MKSAYELAMERLEKEQGPVQKLSDEQRELMAEIDRKYDAQAAEVRLTLESQIADAANVEDLQEAQARLSRELASVEERRERDKKAVWEKASSGNNP